MAGRRGGITFGRGSLFYLLRNRFYIGEVKYKNEILPGEQKVACPAASASSGSAIRRQTGAGNLRRSASIRNKRKLSNYHARVVPEFVWIRQRHHSQHFVTFSVDALSRRQNAIIPDCALKICFTTC